jgi:hypothetical protein
MASLGTITIESRLQPASPAGSTTQNDYALSGSISIKGDTDTIAQIVLEPADFVEGSSATEPLVELDIKDGTDPGSIIVQITNGGGGETVTATVIERVAGVNNDFAKVRAIHIRALPANPANPSKLKALAWVGDLNADAWDRAALPVGYDSTEADRTAESCALLGVPRGIAYSDSNPLNVKFYQTDNARLLISLLGK